MHFNNMTTDEEDLMLLILGRDGMIQYSKEFAKHLSIITAILAACIALSLLFSFVWVNVVWKVVMSVIATLVGLEWLCNLIISISVWKNTAKSVKIVKTRVKEIG